MSLREGARPSAGLLFVVAPVGPVGVDGVGREDLAGVQMDDGDGGVVGEEHDAFAAVGGADAEVMHAAGSAEADLPVGADVVVAEPVVAGVGDAARGGGFRGRGVGVRGCSVVEGAVRAAVVVVLAERVELGLELSGRPRSGSGGEPAFQGLVEAFDLPLGLGGGSGRRSSERCAVR